MMRVDASGEVVSIPEGVRPEFDPETGMIVDIHGDPAALSFEGELPSFRDTVWQERAALAPGRAWSDRHRATVAVTSCNTGAPGRARCW